MAVVGDLHEAYGRCREERIRGGVSVCPGGGLDVVLADAGFGM